MWLYIFFQSLFINTYFKAYKLFSEKMDSKQTSKVKCLKRKENFIQNCATSLVNMY